MPDTRKLDAKATAEAIRPLLATDPAPISAEERHIDTFMDDVCKHLDQEPTTINKEHDRALMTKLGIEMYHADQYPKALTHKDELNREVETMWPVDHPLRANTPVVWASAEEEAFYKAHPDKALSQDELSLMEPKPTPTPASGPGVVPPVVKPVVVVAPPPVPPSPTVHPLT